MGGMGTGHLPAGIARPQGWVPPGLFPPWLLGPAGWREVGIRRGPGVLGLALDMLLAPPRPLIKLHIIWKKDGVPLSSGISDYSRRLTILNPTLSDSGYYECEAVLRSSSVPAVAEGAYLSVLGETLAAGSPSHLCNELGWSQRRG